MGNSPANSNTTTNNPTTTQQQQQPQQLLPGSQTNNISMNSSIPVNNNNINNNSMSNDRPNLARRNTADVVQNIIAKGPIGNYYDVDYKTVLGKGHYAIVNLGRNRQTGEHVAVKRIQIARSRVEALKAEITVLLEVGRHPNIVELKDVFLTETEVQLVMELLRGGELFDRMVEKGPYSELEASRHVRKIAEALQYLHSKGIVHRDLKPENLILVDSSPDADLKIADFGLSKIVQDMSTMMHSVVGTWAYAAPEVRGATAFTPQQPGVTPKSNYTAKVDMWSLGVILYVILAAFHPFDPDGNCSDVQLWQNICRGKFTFDDPVWMGISESVKDLIRHLIVVDPELRYSTQQLLSHPWITQSSQVPQTPITPKIDANLGAYKKKGKYNQAGVYTPAMPAFQQQQQQPVQMLQQQPMMQVQPVGQQQQQGYDPTKMELG
jgi:calcium/calmodulin-dependent protein kinase-4